MPVKITEQKFFTLWKQPDGPGTAMVPFSVVAANVNRHGMGDLTLPGPGREVIFGTDADYKYVELLSPDSPPGGLPNTTINFVGSVGFDFLEQLFKTQQRFYFQRRYTDCGRADDPVSWEMVEGFPNASITQLVPAAAPVVPAAAGANQQYTATISLGFNYSKILRSTLTQVVNAYTQNWLSVWALEGLQECIPGYQGIDQVLFFGGDDTGAAVAQIYYSLDGGSTVQAIATDPSPFTQFVGVSAGLAFPVSKTQFRILTGAEGIAGTDAQLAYADISIGATTVTVSSWTGLTIADTADATGVTHMIRATPDIYVATFVSGDGNIYRSVDNGATDPGSPVWSGAVQINRLHQAPDGQVWAAGASNTLLRGDCSGFAALTGPNAGTINHSVAVAKDGTVFVGNSTNIYRGRNVDTGTWDLKKNFGTNRAVVDIHIIDNNPEQLIAVVDNAAPGPGELWLSLDGGNSWEQYTDPGSPNDGYNAAYFSKNGLYNGNWAVIVGDVDTTAAIHKLAPPSVGIC